MGMTIEDGAKIGVIGGGPAGSMFAYFLLTFADRVGLNVNVDVYEPRDFTKPGPGGCNMCGGIVSESLVQALATEGIVLPTTVVQRGIDSYILHTAEKSVRIDTPNHEKKIAAVHRGGGPRDLDQVKWGGIDGYLLGLAKGLGARVIPAKVGEVGWSDGRPQITIKGEATTYDLLVGATGVNSTGWALFESLGLKSKKPETAKTYITELKLGSEAISQSLGNSMHVFLINLPGVDCAAIIPKGDFATVCLLGNKIDNEVIDNFFEMEAVKRCFPGGWTLEQGACHCAPKINVVEASRPFMDRLVLVGDCGATRLYKDGIGAAYRTSKAAALTAVFHGVSAKDFQKHYLPTHNSIAGDNRYGKVIFLVVHIIKVVKPLVRGVTGMVSDEQKRSNAVKRMSSVLWDTFTGSAPYRDVFLRTLDPRFLTMLTWESILSVGRSGARKG